MKIHEFVCKELPISQVERDLSQPRTDFGEAVDENHLLNSIKELGIDDPLKVVEVEPGRYVVIDGNRRYKCAKKLGMTMVPCRIYPNMSVGELETRRYNMQNNRRAWKPMERANAFDRIKEAYNFRTNREVAQHLGHSETLVNNALELRKLRFEYLEKMQDLNLAPSCRTEFIRLLPKLRNVRELDPNDIVEILFRKIRIQVITNVRGFRDLSKVFLRASANEADLYRFLTNDDMSIEELNHRTSEVGFSLSLEDIIESVTFKKANDIAFTEQETIFLGKLKNLLDQHLSA